MLRKEVRRLKDISTPSFNSGSFNPRHFNHEFSTPWFKNSWLKSPGLKNSLSKSLGLGLKLGVEKSGVEMSFNKLDGLNFNIISYFRTIPESPRWLVAEGRLDEALAILKNGAKTNNKQLPPDDELMEMLTAIAADVSETIFLIFCHIDKLFK